MNQSSENWSKRLSARELAGRLWAAVGGTAPGEGGGDEGGGPRDAGPASTGPGGHYAADDRLGSADPGQPAAQPGPRRAGRGRPTGSPPTPGPGPLDAGRARPAGLGPGARALADALAALVDRGELSAGARLPTERALAGELGVARGTVSAAYRMAKERGRLVARQGSGTIVSPSAGAARAPRRPGGGATGARGRDVAGRLRGGPGSAEGNRLRSGALPRPMFASLGSGPADVIDLALAETRCVDATRDLLAGLGPTWLVDHVSGTGYQPQGLPRLRERLAGHLRSRGLPTSADQLVVTVGAQGAIALTALSLLPPGGTVLVEEATYPGALDALGRAAGRFVTVPSDDAGPLPEALDEVLGRERPGLAYFIPVGGNPTAGVWTAPRLGEVCAVLARHRALVIDDRTPELLDRSGRRLPTLASRLGGSQVVTVGSLSKVAWAGLRCGWAAASPPLVAELVATRLALDLSVPLTSQALAAELLPQVGALVDAVRVPLAEACTVAEAAMAEHLPDWRFDPPMAGAWLWAQLPAGDAVRFAEVAAAHDVLFAPGPLFSAHGGLADRARLALVAEPALIREGVARLGTAWRAYRAEVERPSLSLRIVL